MAHLLKHVACGTDCEPCDEEEPEPEFYVLDPCPCNNLTSPHAVSTALADPVDVISINGETCLCFDVTDEIITDTTGYTILSDFSIWDTCEECELEVCGDIPCSPEPDIAISMSMSVPASLWNEGECEEDPLPTCGPFVTSGTIRLGNCTPSGVTYDTTPGSGWFFDIYVQCDEDQWIVGITMQTNAPDSPHVCDCVPDQLVGQTAPASFSATTEYAIYLDENGEPCGQLHFSDADEEIETEISPGSC